MTFDIARAWKDEEYRQSLDEEQISLLPANPVGELTEAELESVSGGFGGPGFAGFGGPGFFGAPAVGVPAAVGIPAAVGVAHVRNESLAVLCELNIFSVNVIANIAILGSVTQICAKG